EKDFFPRLLTVLTSYINSATSIVVGANQGQRVRKGDIIRSMTGGDAMYVQSVTGDTLTVVRNIGAKAAQAGTAGDTLLIASNASPQGADFPDTLGLHAV